MAKYALLILPLLMSGCAGAKVVLGLDYLFRNNQTTAESQFWPSASAQVEENDEYVLKFEVHVPLGVTQTEIVNLHELAFDNRSYIQEVRVINAGDFQKPERSDHLLQLPKSRSVSESDVGDSPEVEAWGLKIGKVSWWVYPLIASVIVLIVYMLRKPAIMWLSRGHSKAATEKAKKE